MRFHRRSFGLLPVLLTLIAMAFVFIQYTCAQHWKAGERQNTNKHEIPNRQVESESVTVDALKSTYRSVLEQWGTVLEAVIKWAGGDTRRGSAGGNGGTRGHQHPDKSAESPPPPKSPRGAASEARIFREMMFHDARRANATVVNMLNEIKGRASNNLNDDVPTTLQKRQVKAIETCSDVGVIATSSLAMYTCSGVLDSSSTTYSEVELNALWETHPRCSDCGITTPYNQTAETLPEIIDFQAVGSKSNTRTYPYNVDLTSAETCAYNCCDPTGGTIVSKASCECPSDRTNADCSGVLPFECTVELVAPQLPCSDPYAPYEMKRKLYESKDCLKFSLEDTAIELSYAVSCRQVDAVPEAGDTPFEYFIERRDVNLVLTDDPQLYLEFRIFNFFKLNDISQTTYTSRLTPAQMTGEQLFTFTVDAAALRAARRENVNFLTGGRVYIEAALGSLLYDGGLVGIPVVPTFLDFFDLPKATGTNGSGENAEQLSAWVYVGIGLAILVV